MSKSIFSISIIAILISVVSIQHSKIMQVSAERDLYQMNTQSLMSDIQELRKDSSYQAHQIQALSINIDEYEKYRASDAQVIKDLKLKIKRVSSVSKQQLEVQVPISAPVKDTILIISNKPDTVRTIQYKDPHVSFNGHIKQDSLKAVFQVPVTITQVIHKIPKRKFLWWSWGCKAIKQVIVTNNPYVQLNYAEYIELKK